MMQTMMQVIILVQMMMHATMLMQAMMQAIDDGGVCDKWSLTFFFITMHQIGFSPSHSSWSLSMNM